MAESINDFLKRRKQGAGSQPAIDWDARRDEWLRQVDVLYQRILGWLKPSLDEAVLTASYNDVEIEEEDIKAYRARSLIMNFGDSRVRFLPMGTRVIGARGRVDMEGEEQSRMLLLGPRGWSIVTKEPGSSPRTELFTEHTFSDVLRAMLGG